MKRLLTIAVSAVTVLLAALFALAAAGAVDEETTDDYYDAYSTYYTADYSQGHYFTVGGKGAMYYRVIVTVDTDGDGKLSAADARGVLRIALALDELRAPLASVDVDCDGKVTAADARGVLRYAVGLDTAYVSAEGSFPKGWARDRNGDRYYFTSGGILKTGIVKDTAGGIYYFAPDGRMTTGPVKVGDTFYYLTDNGKKYTGLLGNDKELYYFKDSVAAEGFATVNGATYYFGADHKAVKGLVEIGGKKYLFSDEFKMLTGKQNVGGVEYYFGSDGAMLVDTVVDGVVIGKDGKTDGMATKAYDFSSQTEYLILVDLTTHHVGIYKGKRHEWKLEKYWLCSDGAPESPTPTGTYAVTGHGRYFNTGENDSERCWYTTQFWGNYLFHSVVYYRDPEPERISDGRLGEAVSHGCVRLPLDQAKWMYDNIPIGTKVFIYR